MNHQEIISAYSNIVLNLGRKNRKGKDPIHLDFVVEDLSLHAVDVNSGSKLLLATNKRVNGNDLFAWQPEQVAYLAMELIIDSVRQEFRGTGAPISERNARLIAKVKESFSDLALSDGYEPR